MAGRNGMCPYFLTKAIEGGCNWIGIFLENKKIPLATLKKRLDMEKLILSVCVLLMTLVTVAVPGFLSLKKCSVG